jgi:hypothetical protein
MTASKEGGMRRMWTGAARMTMVLAIAIGLAACGGDDDGGGAATKAEWEEEHGDLVAAFSRDLDATNNTINQGEKTATLNACTQLRDDAQEMRSEVFPVPNDAVNGPLRRSVDLAIEAADNCLQGGRSADGARQVESAMAQLNDARSAFNEARAAIDAWQ